MVTGKEQDLILITCHHIYLISLKMCLLIGVGLD